MGWHVHYEQTNGRVGVCLVCDQTNAIDTAHNLIREGRKVIRVIAHDGKECIRGAEVAHIIGDNQSFDAPELI